MHEAKAIKKREKSEKGTVFLDETQHRRAWMDRAVLGRATVSHVPLRPDGHTQVHSQRT